MIISIKYPLALEVREHQNQFESMSSWFSFLAAWSFLLLIFGLKKEGSNLDQLASLVMGYQHCIINDQLDLARLEYFSSILDFSCILNLQQRLVFIAAEQKYWSTIRCSLEVGLADYIADDPLDQVLLDLCMANQVLGFAENQTMVDL